jgi:hypothetical protein
MAKNPQTPDGPDQIAQPDANVDERLAEPIALADLLLDSENPRFGGLENSSDQSVILDHIVMTFGVSDVISSLAVNGYFKAEPLVGRGATAEGKYIIAEGNRRLAACLILSNESRAKNQKKLGERYRKIWQAHDCPSIDPVPVIVFRDVASKKSLLSYLGVRHISSSQPWDSFAKAAWISKVVTENALSVSDVAQMVGDQHRTVARLLEGFHFVRQAERTGQFRPQDSQRSGRGSVTAYPFSWIYTILGYSTVRNFLGLSDNPINPNPVPDERLANAGILCRAMFGDRSKGMSSAISDSRQLGDLAAAFGSSTKISLLEQGNSVEDINRLTQPIDERLRQGLGSVRKLQQELISGLSENEIIAEVAEKHHPAAIANRRSASEIEKRLKEVISPSDDE